MDYKKKYKDALAHAREIHRNEEEKRKDMEFLFPELRNIEDEEIRKEIINYFECQSRDEPTRKDIHNKWIDWLKRQGNRAVEEYNITGIGTIHHLGGKLGEIIKDIEVEPFDKYEGLTDFERTLADVCFGWIGEELGWKQYIKDNADVLLKIAIEKFNSVQDVPFEQKPAYNIKPNFNAGDLITNNACTFKITSIKDGFYWTDNDCVGGDIESIDKEYHLWTIEDAKDGDVLTDKYNNIGIFQKCEGICWHSYIYLGCDRELRGFGIGGSHEQINTHPATKEQRGQLEKAMAEAGYTFDFEKKELKNI